MKGLSFSTPMMLAWLEGRKRVTRRIMNPQPPEKYSEKYIEDGWLWSRSTSGGGSEQQDVWTLPMARYQPGETVYIKETWRPCSPWEGTGKSVQYRADKAYAEAIGAPDMFRIKPSGREGKWRPSLLMPEWASRGHALIVSVRAETIQEMADEEAEAEGVSPDPVTYGDCCFLDAFIRLWEALSPGSWGRNEWVFRYELKKLED